MIKRYLHLYLQILSFRLKSDLSYRLNYFLKIFYGPAYLGVMLVLIEIAFTKAPQLGGLSKNEGILLYSVFSSLYAVSILFFIQGFKHFLWHGLRLGELDFILIRPVSTQFLVAFTWPTFEQLPLITGEFLLFSRQLWLIRAQITPVSILFFCIMVILAMVILYLMISTYATLGFYVTKAAQIIEILDKSADFANYPTSIFPSSIQTIMFSLLPIAFCSYVPTLFLLNRGNLWLFLGAILLIVIFYSLNRWAWQQGLKQYSSASS